MSLSAERKEWTSLEDSLLREAVKECQAQTGSLNWTLIATHVPGRDRKACHKRWFNTLGTSFNKGAWSPDEDARLLQAVAGSQSEHAAHSIPWALIATHVRTRSGDQCLQRWRNSLDPGINRAEWSVDEDRALLDAVARYGRNWAEIASQVFGGGRNALAVRNREKVLRNREKVEVASAAGPVLFLNKG